MMKMVRPSGKHSFTKSTVVLAFGGFLVVALTVDFLWASSSSSSSSAYLSVASNWASQKNQLIVIPNATDDDATEKIIDGKESKDRIPERLLSATFADLPAPGLEWEQMPSAPVPRLDGSAIQIENLLYVFAGYGTLDYVHSHVDVYNFTDNTWGGRFAIPKEIANSHLGWLVMEGIYMWFLGNMVPSAELLLLIHLCSTLRPENGIACHHYQHQDMLQLLKFGRADSM